MSRFSKDDEFVTDLELASLDITVRPAHDQFGIILDIDYPIRSAPLPKGWVRHLVERYGLVVIPRQNRLIDDPSLFIASIRHVLADVTSSANEDLATIEGHPQVQVLGSPNSAFAPNATFIPARAAETSDSLSNWLDDSIPCAVTDWHVDEPWENSPVKFTLVLSARSSGPNSTLFASTAALYERTNGKIKEKLEHSTTTFAPPPWLPSEEGFEASHSTVQCGPHGKSYYICMDSTRCIDAFPNNDREAKEVIWNLTKSCTNPENVYRHQWSEGDLLIWDNTRTLHARSEYDESNVDRVLYRMRVFGKKEEVLADGERATRIVCCDESGDDADGVLAEEKKADTDGKVDRMKMMTRQRSSKHIQ